MRLARLGRRLGLGMRLARSGYETGSGHETS